MRSLISVCRTLFRIFELGIVIAVMTLLFDMLRTEEDTVNEAWQLVAIAGGVSGRAADQTMASGKSPISNKNLGLVDTLETLNRRQIEMNDVGLSNAYLAGVQLSEARLSGANLENADLSGADLQGVQLRRANLKKAKLQGANLRMADLSWSDLSDANLDGANLLKVNLSGAKLERASLNGGANMKNTTLVDTVLASANLSYADMSEAYVVNTNLQKANVFHTKLCRSIIIETDVKGIQHADGAYLSGVVSTRNKPPNLLDRYIAQHHQCSGTPMECHDYCQTEPIESSGGSPSENASMPVAVTYP